MIIGGEGALKCSFGLSLKVLADCPIYSSSHSSLSHLYLYFNLLSFVLFSLSLGANRNIGF